MIGTMSNTVDSWQLGCCCMTLYRLRSVERSPTWWQQKPTFHSSVSFFWQTVSWTTLGFLCQAGHRGVNAKDRFFCINFVLFIYLFINAKRLHNLAVS